MRRPHDNRQARDFGPGPSRTPPELSPKNGVITANDNHWPGSSYASALPQDALAIIEPMPLAVHQSGRASAGMWRLRFAERRPQRLDPLTGWTGGGDPIGQIELHFRDLEAAEAYCRRQGIRFERRGSARMRHPVMPCLEGEAPPRLCCWPSGPHPLCCGDPASGWAA